MPEGRYRSEQPDLLQKIKELEGRISNLERTPNIGNTAIDSGALVVKDASGVVQCKLGLLDDGTYGLSVRDPGLNTFRQVPYVYTSFTGLSGEVCSSTTYTDLATFGPSVTVPISSTGRILVIASAQTQWGAGPAATSRGDGRFDLDFSGANTRSPNEAVDQLVGTAVHEVSIVGGNTATDVGIFGNTMQSVFEGLASGNTTITMKYRKGNSSTVDVTFFRRTLTVIRL